MSGVGPSELIMLALIGLIVLGPERLPRIASQLGSWLGQARRMTRVMKRQLETELDFDSTPDIRPPQAKRTAPGSPEVGAAGAPAVPKPSIANQHDDTYSPAHEPDIAASDNKPKNNNS